MKLMSIKIPETLNKRLKAVAVFEGDSAQDLATRLLSEALQPLESRYLTSTARKALKDQPG